MTLVQRLVREPVAIIGVLTALFGVLTVFDVGLTEEQTGALIVLAGAIMAVLRFITTPAAEVVAQLKPGAVRAIAGPASAIKTGAPVDVELDVISPDENGAVDLTLIYYVLGIVFFVIATLYLLGANTRGIFN